MVGKLVNDGMEQRINRAQPGDVGPVHLKRSALLPQRLEFEAVVERAAR